MADKVEVLDSIMGSGKTTAMLQWMTKNYTERYIYISPLLSEVEERLVDTIPELSFIAPDNECSTKSEDLLKLLKEGRNIGATHNLFRRMTKEHLKWVKDWGYIVVVDEELEMIMPYTEYSRGDLMWLGEKGTISIGEKQELVWKDDSMPDDTKYQRLRNMCDLGMLYVSKRDWSMVTIQLPTELITSAKRVIVLTYMFEGSIFDKFLEMKGIAKTRFTEVDGQVLHVSKSDIKRLVSMIGDKQVLPYDDGTKAGLLSSSWYTKSTSDLSTVSVLIRNICRGEDAKAEDVMWTAKGSYSYGSETKGKRLVKPKGYLKYKTDGAELPCWVACNAKATNKYQNKSVLVHCYNRYPHTVLRAFMADVGYPIDDDRFAIAEMLQWIWRSRIRKGEEIKLAILSKRMRELFLKWLND